MNWLESFFLYGESNIKTIKKWIDRVTCRYIEINIYIIYYALNRNNH